MLCLGGSRGQNPRRLRPLGFWPWDLPRYSIHHDTSSAFSNNVTVHCTSVHCTMYIAHYTLQSHTAQVLKFKLPHHHTPDSRDVCLIVKDIEKGIKPDHDETVRAECSVWSDLEDHGHLNGFLAMLQYFLVFPPMK